MGMDDIRKLKKEVVLYGGLVALACESLSFFVLGWNLFFLIGLAAGLAVGILNFFIMVANLQVMLDSKKQSISFVGYFARMVLYCVVLFFCLRKGLIPGGGCLLGILATKMPLFYIYAFKNKFDKGRKIPPEVQAMYEEEDQKKREKEEQRWQGDNWDQGDDWNEEK